jgi:hypothetical protein
VKYFEIKYSDGICIYCKGRRVPNLENATYFCQAYETSEGIKMQLTSVKLLHVVEVSEADALKYGKYQPEFPLYEPTIHDAGYDSDKFLLHPDGRIHWVYWNPDGFGEKGQFVQHCLSDDNIRKVGVIYDDNGNYDSGKFYERLNDYGKQYLWDNDGSDEFSVFEEEFFDDSKYHIIDCTDETMLKLVNFAACEDNNAREKFILAIEGDSNE